MSKPIDSLQTAVFCGIDVSAATLAVAVIEQDQPLQQREFANRASGHKALIGWLHKRKAQVRVSLEATGIYSLDLALALNEAPGIEVAVLNPKMANRFAQTLRRSKTDAADALVLAEYRLSDALYRLAAAQPECASIARRGSPYRGSGGPAYARAESVACSRRVSGCAALCGPGPEAFADLTGAADREDEARGPCSGA